MKIEFGKILEATASPVGKDNKANPDFQGVLVGDRSVLIGSGTFVVEIKNIEVETEIKPGSFFSFLEGKFTDYKYPMTPEAIFEEIKVKERPVGMSVFPLISLINIFDRLKNETEPTSKKTLLERSRTVFSSGILGPDEFAAKLNFKDGRFGLFSGGLNIPLSKDSVMPAEFLTENTVYRCILIGDEVSVIDPFGKARLGVLVSPGGYIDVDVEKLNLLTGVVDPRLIVTSNILEPGDLLIPPVHVCSELLSEVLGIVSLGKGNLMEVHFPSDPVAEPIIIKNARVGSDDLEIKAYIAPLDYINYGVARR